MNVIAVNSSPRGGGRSKTELMLNHLVEGMRAAGAEVDTVNLREKKIKNCIGCFTCWTKTPGQCIHKDDMTSEIYPKWLAAENMTTAFYKDLARDILDATTRAGWELVEIMTISAETLGRITQPLMDVAAFAQMGNLFWKTCIAEGVTPKKFDEENMVPRPDSLETFMLLFPAGLNAEAGDNRKVILQFHFSGQVDGTCYFEVASGRIAAREGTSATPDLTIETPFDVWMDIMTRKADGQQMFLDQKYRVTGDLALMIALFKRDEGHRD